MFLQQFVLIFLFTLSTGIVCQEAALNGTDRIISQQEDDSAELVTSDPDEFELFLKGLAKKKEDRKCETKTLSAVLKAVATGKPRSYIFIFTNGPAKDYYLVSKVLEKITEKQSQIVFFLGNLCAAPGHVGYQVYERIARHSLGQVLHVRFSTDKDLALKFVNTAIQVNKVQLLSVNAKGPGTRTFSFLVDSHLKNIVMSTVGKSDVQVRVKYPGEKEASSVEKVIKSRKVLVTKIKRPQEGIWSIDVKSAGNYSLRVTSESPFFVNYGFSTTKFNKKGEDFKLRKQPVLDATNYLYVTFKSKTKVGHIGILKHVDILRLNGKLIKSIPISLDSLLEDSFVIKFIPPRDPFLLRFAGVDDRGDFERVSPSVVEPGLPDPPKIILKPHYEGTTRQDLALFCYVESAVPFTLTWSRGNIPFSHPTNYVKSVNSSLWIPVESADNGVKFSCSARNIAGLAVKTTTITVKAAPVAPVAPPIIESTGNKTALLGENVLLQCLAFSTEPIKIKWFKDNKQIKTEGRFVVTTDLQIAISSTMLEDSGWYFCVASNTGGKSVASFHYKVYEDPIISVYPQIQVFKAGDSISFLCDVVGQFPPIITWLKDDKDISMDTRIQTSLGNQLFINEAVVADEGKYTCVANYTELRSGVVVKSSSFAEFRTPPKAKISSEHLSILAGSSAAVKCVATGKPDPEITWHKNGEPVVFNKRIVMSDRSLFILETKLEDTGSYSCIAKNSEGLDFASVHMLVGKKPLINEEKVRTVEVEKESNVTLECTAEGMPAPFVYWIGTDGKEIEKNKEIVRLPSGKLFIKTMKKKFAGKYLCKAENQFGSEMAQIDVEMIGFEKPKIASLEKSLLYANIGDEIILPCDVSGTPRPIFKWVRRGGNFNLKDSRFKILQDGGLLIKNISVEDSATYVCKATNRVGSTKADRKLIVTIPPVWTLKPGELYDLFEGEELRLECFASGIPRPKITWKHNGRLLPIKEDVLVIKEVNQTNNGTYRCIARNEGGRITAQTKVVVKDFNIVDVSSFELPGRLAVPQPLETRATDVLRFVALPEDVRIRPGVSYVFNCVARGNPPPVVTWQRSGVELDAPLNIMPNNSLVINSARIEDSGFYACVAENDRGKIMKDFMVMVVVDGGFSIWSDWGPCSKSCGEGRQLRQRYCNNPTPRNGGKRCEGIHVQQRLCNQNPCVSRSNEAPWSAWGPCSRSCAGGRQYRFRTCLAGTAACPTGMHIVHRICNIFKCGGIFGITEVIGSITGTINRKDIGSIALMAQISYDNQFVKISLDVKNIPKPLLYTMRSVVSFLVPIYWSVVNQGQDGFNGISVAVGKFTYTGKIKYNDVQILSTKCVVSSIPGSKSLMMETSLSGDVQHFPRNGFTPQNYNELFLQTSSTSVHGTSERYILIGDASTKYYLEHSFVYNSDRKLNFPSQIYNVRPDSMIINEDELSIRHEITASYVEGKNECPAGFLQEDSFCVDLNECEDPTRCEQRCINTNGSFYCGCNKGYFLSRDRVSCQDINECRQSLHNCQDHEICINTRGGYECKEKDCLPGYEKDPVTRKCFDINECIKKDICPDDQSCINTDGSFECMWNPCPEIGLIRSDNGTCIDIDECSGGVCKSGETCENTFGSYKCVGQERCGIGFILNSATDKCEDINECVRDVCKATEVCLNTEGSYECFSQSCDVGFKNVDGNCADINECEVDSSCAAGQRCINTEGSFFCLDLPCETGYRRQNGTCQDIDECENKPNPCPDGSLCVNLVPRFTCILKPCKRGYKFNSNKRECHDIDECKTGEANCKKIEICRNTIGSFVCSIKTCSPGFEVDTQIGDCVDINECSKGIHNCFPEEICVNKNGTFTCEIISTTAPSKHTTTNAATEPNPKTVTEPIILASTVITTDAPVAITDAPVTKTDAPITSKISPAVGKTGTYFPDAFLATTDAPKAGTAASVVKTNTRISSESSPAIVKSETSFPDAFLATKDAPTASTDDSVIGTDTPVIPTDAPVINTDPPVIATDAPVVATDAPVVATASPVVATDAPIIATDAPVVATDPLVVATASPVVATDAPIIATDAPVVATDAITERHNILVNRPDESVTPKVGANKVVATSEPGSTDEGPDLMLNVETELPTETGIKLPDNIIKENQVSEESTITSPVLVNEKTSTKKPETGTDGKKIVDNSVGEKILTDLPGSGNETNKEGLKKTQVPFEPDTEDVNKQKVNITIQGVAEPAKKTLSPTRIPTSSKKSSPVVPYAVPLVTDNPDIDPFWWIFNGGNTPTPLTTARQSQTSLTKNRKTLSKTTASIRTQTSTVQTISYDKLVKPDTDNSIAILTNGVNGISYASAAADTEPPTKAIESAATKIVVKETATQNKDAAVTDSTTNAPVVVTDPPVVVTDPPVVVTDPPVVATDAPVVVTDPPVVATDAPVVITDPPVATTDPPVVVTDPPVVTTDAPVVITDPTVATTDPPVVVTDPPVVVTDPPVVATDAPVVTTDAPVVITNPPVATTEAPVVVTDPPVVATDPPAVATDAPVVTTDAPVVITNPPVATTEAPVVVTDPPAVTTDAPVVATDAPVAATDPPVAATDPPVAATDPPVVATDPPVVATDPPVVATDPPVVATDPPFIATDAPVAATDPPMAATDAPVVATDPPVVATDPPVVATDPPVVATDPPIVATDAPVVATDPPVVDTDPPVVATDPPVVATDAPVVTTDPPLVATDLPVVATDASVVATDPPVVATDPPVVATDPPVVDTDPAVVATDAPVVATDGPVVATDAPVVATDPPVVATDAPVVATDPPVVATDAPVVATDGPVVATDAPVVATDPPVVATDAPVVATDGPVVATDPPVVATDAPVVATDPPVVATDAPVVATDPPVVATDAPVVATDAPVVATDPPVVATDRPVVATDAPVVATDAPVVATDPPVVATDAPISSIRCPMGHQANAVGVCVDINECKDNSHSCKDDQICVNFKGGHRCACKRGFRMRDGDRKCIDINECRMTLRLCQQDCVNTIGSYRCKCRMGYTLKADQRGCQADAETSQNNMMGRRARVMYAEPIRCFSFMGSTICFCPSTYKWNRHGMRCEKTVVFENSIKENSLSTNPTRCFTFRGTKMCKCPSAYKWDMKQQLCILSLNTLGENQVGLKKGGTNVRESDILPKVTTPAEQEIITTTTAPTTTAATIATTEKPCPKYFARTCSYKCMTMNNMYLCTCPAGYINKFHGYCSDVNECATGQNGCTKDQSCFNTLGSYRCMNFNCPEGFLNYGRRVCRKPCKRRPSGPHDICTDNFVSFHQFAVPRNVRVNSHLATLSSSSYYSFLGRTQFYFKDGQSFFKLRKVGSVCSLYTRRDITTPGDYSVEIIGDVINRRGQLLCRTTFKILVNVGQYTF